MTRPAAPGDRQESLSSGGSCRREALISTAWRPGVAATQPALASFQVSDPRLADPKNFPEQGLSLVATWSSADREFIERSGSAQEGFS